MQTKAADPSRANRGDDRKFRLSESRRRLIQLARARLAMEDADYRAMLERVAGVRSSVDLAADGFEAVMREFKRLGFVSSRDAPTYGGKRLGMATPKQLALIRSLWRKYAGRDDDASLIRFVEKKVEVTHLRFLGSEAAGRVICILRSMKRWRGEHPRPNAKARAARSLQATLPIEPTLDENKPPF